MLAVAKPVTLPLPTAFETHNTAHNKEKCANFILNWKKTVAEKKIKAWLAFFLGTSSTLLCYGIGYISIARSNFSCRCAQAKSKRQK